MDGEQGFQDGTEFVEVEGVGAVGFSLGWIVVDFEEEAIDTGRYGGAGENGDELGLTAADGVSASAAGAGGLY